MPKFFTRQGWLTFYSLSCGYIHETKISHPAYTFGYYYLTLSLLNGELGTYVVHGGGLWMVAESLPEARKLYREKARQAGYKIARRPSTKQERDNGAPAYVYG